MDCKLKLTDEKIIFKPVQKGSKTETLESQELEMVNWQRLAGSWGIRIFTKSGNLYRFAGFKDTERERLARFFKQTYDMDMLDKELSVKGNVLVLIIFCCFVKSWIKRAKQGIM